MPVLLLSDGSALLVGSNVITVTDVCSGVLLLLLLALFLTLGGMKLRKILTVVGFLFIVNLLRVFTVSFVLLNFGLEEASLLHSIYYFVFTALAIGIMIYAAFGSMIREYSRARRLHHIDWS